MGRQMKEQRAGQEERLREILESETKKRKPIETMKSALIFPQLLSRLLPMKHALKTNQASTVPSVTGLSLGWDPEGPRSYLCISPPFHIPPSHGSGDCLSQAQTRASPGLRFSIPNLKLPAPASHAQMENEGKAVFTQPD